MTQQSDQRGSWLALRWGDVGRAVLSLFGATVGFVIASWIVPNFEVEDLETAFVAAVLVGVLGAVLRPLLVRGAVLFGWLGAVLLGLFGQALVIVVVLFTVSDLGDTTILGAFFASWVVAGVSTLFVWIATAGTDDAVVVTMLRKARRHPATVPDPQVPGVLFVQADGVPFPVLEWGVRAATLPTLSRWMRSGSHRMAEWRPKLPATTPASQMGILHGTIEGIPAFRWVDRAEGRVYVANKPADAAVIERKHSNGQGLLVDDGVAVSNLFTGDAPTAYACMSSVGRGLETKETRTAISQFLAHPSGLARSVSRTFSELGRELFQRSRARRRDVRPRVHRGWGFAGERAALSGLMRDLNTSLVAEAMLKGRKSIYVNFVDYDGVAHHVGMMQPEALASLEGIDAVLGQLERVAQQAPRKYHIVVLSDHGQSQGEVFSDRYGEDLATLVSRLAQVDVIATEHNAEGSGTLNAMVAGSTDTGSVMGRAMGKASERLATQSFDAVDAADEAERRQAASDTQEEQFLVFGSGNLGLVYVAGESRRLTREDLDARFPALIAGLASHPGVGFLVVDTVDHGPVAVGANGEHRVRDGIVVGDDPLARFGPDAPRFVLRAASMYETPDILVNSLLDELGEVAAFEGLVGCHGGLGGWQDRASLVWPAEFPAPDELVVGADALHRVLVGWLEHLGHRRDLPGIVTSD
ncbi:MAG TPA: phage holin family protein [Ornithinibacter sp.]|nr:phage holin family protein [Ornithinibacter sp.]